MTEQKYKTGQIVRYTGPDLVTYETGKTYTVLGYNAAFDMYGILSELDEAYLLPDDVLQPLSEEETEEIRISERMYEYYRQDGTGSMKKDSDRSATLAKKTSKPVI